MDKPTTKDVIDIASAAEKAATERASELGYDGLEWMFGIERLYNAIISFAKLTEILGEDGMDALCETFRELDEYRMHKEAEEILKGGSDD